MRRVRALIDAHKAMQLGRHHEAECRPDAAQPAPANGALQQAQHPSTDDLAPRNVGPAAHALRVHRAPWTRQVYELAHETAKERMLERSGRRKIGGASSARESRLPRVNLTLQERVALLLDKEVDDARKFFLPKPQAVDFDVIGDVLEGKLEALELVHQSHERCLELSGFPRLEAEAGLQSEGELFRKLASDAFFEQLFRVDLRGTAGNIKALQGKHISSWEFGLQTLTTPSSVVCIASTPSVSTDTRCVARASRCRGPSCDHSRRSARTTLTGSSRSSFALIATTSERIANMFSGITCSTLLMKAATSDE